MSTAPSVDANFYEICKIVRFRLDWFSNSPPTFSAIGDKVDEIQIHKGAVQMAFSIHTGLLVKNKPLILLVQYSMIGKL